MKIILEENLERFPSNFKGTRIALVYSEDVTAMSKKNKNESGSAIAYGITFGMMAGVVVGLFMDNISMGIAFGMLFGIVIGSIFEK